MATAAAQDVQIEQEVNCGDYDQVNRVIKACRAQKDAVITENVKLIQENQKWKRQHDNMFHAWLESGQGTCPNCQGREHDVENISEE